MIKKLLILGVFILIGLTTMAQSRFGINYEMSLPTGSTAGYIGNFSFRGFGVEGRSFINPNFSAGGSFSMHTLYENRDVRSYTEGTVTYTGKQWRYINSYPIMITGHFYNGSDGDKRLYFGGGLGAVRNIQRTEMGIYVTEHKSWDFGLAPEIGLFLPAGFNSDINISAKYHYSFVSTTSIQDISYLSVKIGLIY